MTLALAKEIDLLLKDNPSPACVNVEELKTKYYREFTIVIPNSHMATNNEELGKIWNFFLPHLRREPENEALEIIQELMDIQNGCPLPTWEKDFNAINARADKFLTRHKLRSEPEKPASSPDIEKLRDLMRDAHGK